MRPSWFIAALRAARVERRSRSSANRVAEQRGCAHSRLTCSWLVVALLLAVGCDESQPPARNAGIASLSPALTSIVLGLGGEASLVAVSNYDMDPRVGELPRVGDVVNVDWEKLAELRPSVLVLQQDDQALADRAIQLGITTVPVKIDRLGDIEFAVDVIAEQIYDAERRTVETDAWKQRLDAIAGTGEMRTLLVCGDRSLCAGRGTYLDELLTLAGGVNVLEGEGYLEPDDERVAVLAPEVILVLLPEGDAAAVRGRWERFGARVEIIERADALVPGWNVVEIGEAMRAVLVERRPEGALRGSGRTDPRLRGLSLRLQGVVS